MGESRREKREEARKEEVKKLNQLLRLWLSEALRLS